MATKKETHISGIMEVQEDPETKELYLELPQKMLDKMGWKQDDLLEWVENEDGTWKIIKVTEKKMNKVEKKNG